MLNLPKENGFIGLYVPKLVLKGLLMNIHLSNSLCTFYSFTDFEARLRCLQCMEQFYALTKNLIVRLLRYSETKTIPPPS